MTKERKIAIEMWEYIRDNYEMYLAYRDMHEDDEYYEGEDAIHNLKIAYLAKHDDIDWAMNCWFCMYIAHRRRNLGTGRCHLCPLKSCETGPYDILTRGCTQPLYIEACNQIIEALGGSK